tara:strand:+ start:6534 stop:16046 length:9513 start_codon:yes stop_codon:yes gene_type:complete
MNGKEDATRVGIPLMGLAPVTVVFATLMVLFLGVDYVANGAMENDGYVRILTLPLAAAFGAALGRVAASSSSHGSSDDSYSKSEGSSDYRFGIFMVSFTAILAIPVLIPSISSTIENITIFTIVFMAISTLFLARLSRNEEANILLAVVIGFHLAVSHAAHTQFDSSAWAGSEAELIDASRSATASILFAFWASACALGAILAVAMRGTLDNRGKGPLFADLPTFDRTNKSSMAIMGVMSLILAVQLLPLLWVGSLETLTEYSEHVYLGSVWALVCTFVIFFWAFCRAEGWQVWGALVAVNWILYTLARMVEIGSDFLGSTLSSDDGLSGVAWVFLIFWLNVAAVIFSSRGYFGDTAPRRENSQLRAWWNRNYYGILVGLALFVAIAVRTGWNVLPAMNASGTQLWDMTGGSDPWYMKRVIDYVVAERSHYIFDADRAYPMGAINPRPPLFSWSLALGGIALSWLTGASEATMVWWSVASLPAIYGALIVLPLAAIARRVHSDLAGIFTAWLIALMPGHIGHSTFALADHDSFALLFISMAFYFWVKAMEGLGTDRIFESPSRNPLYLVAGIREMWARNPKVMSNATLSGISFATAALGWKGFVYGPGILFLAYGVQVVMNLFRGRDSLPITAASLQMLFTSFLIPLPFYMWPGMNLLFDPSGFQPMFYIIGFTVALGWVTCSFRDRPWLLVIGSGATLFSGILGALYLLQIFNIYNGWDILFTGGFYFSKNKIFGTIGEAQAPSRGVLFASYGPIVTLIAVSCAFYLIWRGSRKERQSQLLLGTWVIVAAYMAWSAGRFIFNATPAMAVVGGLGMAMLWKSADPTGFVKEWRRSGIGSPSARRKSTWPATKKHPGIPALILVFMLVASQHMTYGIDSGIPRGQAAASDVDQTIYEISPDFLRDLSILNGAEYDSESGQLWYMGTFGPGFNGADWNTAYEWLSQQDTEVGFSERPAFVSWWDYGFQALAQGQHPTVADNFQSGIPNSGGMLLSQGQDDTLALFIMTLAQGDRRSNNGDFTSEFYDVMSQHMETEDQMQEFDSILSIDVGDSSFVTQRSMEIIATDGAVELLRGYSLMESGIPADEESWMVYFDGEPYGEPMNETDARASFDEARGRSSDFEESTTHYMIGNYRYTNDLIMDFDDVSTGLHRANSKLALGRAFLLTAFDSSELVDMYHAITSSVTYEVQDYEEGLGVTVERNNDIRYFAVDNRLYPLGGSYYEDYSYHRGQTTGIFHAPTALSGLDLDNYISTNYLTQRGADGPVIPRTAEQYEEEYLNDVVRQQSGAAQDATEVIQMIDIDYQHQDAFFETMVARVYVGYGSSTLGLPGDASQPAPHFYTTGTPGSPLESAIPMPGAMMNHFALANWYDLPCELDESGEKLDEECNDPVVGNANTQVKVLKYYSGATLTGTVELDGIGPVPNARILVERDAFSGEETADENGDVVDRDGRTYWIPIGTTDADENGIFSFTAPAGKIRVSAFFGEPDLDSARATVLSGNYGMTEILSDSSSNRNINPISGILGNVSGSTWLAEHIVNISGSDGHSNGESHIDVTISVDPTHATGQLVWSGAPEFEGEPIIGVGMELSPMWDEIQMDPYTVLTSNGTVSGLDLVFNGIGEVTFTGEGSVLSTSVVTVSDFTGNFSQEIMHNHTLTGDGLFDGRGTLSGTISDESGGSSDFGCNENGTMPENQSFCELPSGDFLIDGEVNASGRFTSNGSTIFTQHMYHASMVASGSFEVDTSESMDTYGTINGTGTFSGEGSFSGPMVKPGTFHLMDAIPGEYEMTVIFEDGTRATLGEAFIVSSNPGAQIPEVKMMGSTIGGKLVDESDAVLDGGVALYQDGESFSDAVDDCDEVHFSPCVIMPDEDGKLNFGPVVPGNYTVEIDIDNDGFPEFLEDYIFDANEATDVQIPFPITQTFDITFELLDDGLNVPGLNVSFKANDGAEGMVEASFDNESGSYYVELTPGEWLLDHTLDDTKQIWEIIDVDEDSSETFEFRTSMIVSGIVYYEENVSAEFDPDENKLIGSGVTVEFNWDGFSTTAVTNESSEFSISLPEDAVVDATVEGIVASLVAGDRFTVSEGMEDVVMVARPGVAISGMVSVNRANNLYSPSFEGWEQITVTADSDEHEVTWREQVPVDGLFDMVLPEGNWTFDIEGPDFLGASPLQKYIDDKNTSVEMILNPSNGTLSVTMFIDHSSDGNSSNGTLVSYDFEIVPMMMAGAGGSIMANGSEWVQDGIAEVSLEPGTYSVVNLISDPNNGDLFGTRILSPVPSFQIGLDGGVIERSISFDPEWRVSLSLTNESGGPLANHMFRMINLDNGWTSTYYTDSNGSWVEHVEEGSWVLSVEPFTSPEGVSETLRELVQVNEASASHDHSFSTSEIATVSLNLTEDTSGEPLSGFTIVMISEEGLGSIDLEETDSNGTVSASIPPGDWTAEISRVENGVMWQLESDSFTLTPGSNPEISLVVERSAELSGNVYWDFNDDDDSDIGEGVEGVTVSVRESCDDEFSDSGPDSPFFTGNLTTDLNGDWSIFQPSETSWCVSTHMDGFDQEEITVSIGPSPEDVEIELTAGLVGVGGTISYIDETQFSEVSDSVILELFPAEGLVRDPVTPTKNLEDGVWKGNWSAQVEPGEWIIRASVEEDGLIAMANIEADVLEGGFEDMGLISGGWLLLETQWLDYDGISRTLADVESPELVINIGGGISWVAQLDDDGGMRMLLPGGMAETSSEFEVNQMGRNMTYSGGRTVGMQAGQETPPIVISHTRVSNHEVNLHVISSSGGDPSHDGGIEDLLAQLDDNSSSFIPLEFVMGVDYLGHEPFDTFSAQALVPGTDGGDWLVEFHNGSGEWNTTVTFDVGLENTLNFTDLHVRISPANQSVAHSLTNGHSVKIDVFTADGYYTEESVVVRIPQIHGFSAEPMDAVYGVSSGETIQIGIDITNTGNGDEKFEFSFDDSELPEGWERTGATSHTLGAFVSTTHSISVITPENATGGPYTIYASVTDKMGGTYPDIEINVEVSNPEISITGHQSYTGGDPVAFTTNGWAVTVYNGGLVNAPGVTLNGTICGDSSCSSEIAFDTDTRDIPPMSEVTFDISLDLTEYGPDSYYLRFVVVEETVDGEVLPYLEDQGGVSNVDVRSPPVEGTTDWIGWILGALIVLAIGMLTRPRSRRPNAPF